MSLLFSSRYRRIVMFYARVIVGLVGWDLLLARLGWRRWVYRTRSSRLRDISKRYCALANELGGVLIKVGQFLSSRVDVLPDEITSELATLQDEVRAETFADIRRVAEPELGGALEDIFANFDSQPLASASLGQVHRARLRDSENGVQAIVVKVQRPQIEKIIATDLAAIRTVAGWVNLYPPIRRRANVYALLDEFTRILHAELDYLAEGRNAETFGGNFRDEPGVLVPRVIWSLTTKRVLTLEDVFGIKITDYRAITSAGVDRAEVAERLFKTYFKQFFEDGFFHADPHPGNLFVSLRDASQATRSERKEWILTFVDFGMVGRVTPTMRAGLRELAIGAVTRDTRRLNDAYQRLGVLLPGADLTLLERVETKLFDRFWGKTMSELRQIGYTQMSELMHEFRDVIFSLPFQIPEDLILLGRTGAILSGMCTGLNPDFSVWDNLAPYAQQLLSEEGGSAWDYVWKEVGIWARALWDLPRHVETLVERIERGDLVVRIPQVSDEVRRLERYVQQVVGGIIFAGFLFTGAEFYIGGERVIAGILLGASLVFLIWTLGMRRM